MLDKERISEFLRVFDENFKDIPPNEMRQYRNIIFTKSVSLNARHNKGEVKKFLKFLTEENNYSPKFWKIVVNNCDSIILNLR